MVIWGNQATESLEVEDNNSKDSAELQELKSLFKQVQKIQRDDWIEKGSTMFSSKEVIQRKPRFTYNERMLKIFADSLNSPSVTYVCPDTLKIIDGRDIEAIIRLNRLDDVKFALEEFILKDV
jgi:hypothetical protein